MRRRRRKKHTPDRMEQQRRGRKIFRVLGRVLLTGIVLAAAAVAMTVFFKVKTISVEGAKQYGSEELIAGMDVQKGDNLYLWNKNRVLSDLMHSFPYLESAQAFAQQYGIPRCYDSYEALAAGLLRAETIVYGERQLRIL